MDLISNTWYLTQKAKISLYSQLNPRLPITVSFYKSKNITDTSEFEIIEDELTLTLPSTLPAGPYQLVLGLYSEKTGRRLMAGQQDHIILFEGDRIQ